VKSTGWLKATPAGLAAGYVAGCHITHGGRYQDVVEWQSGAVSVVGVGSCLTREGAEIVARRELENSAPLDRDRTIPFKSYFGKGKSNGK